MKENKGIMILAVSLVVLIAGAAVLYSRLSAGYQGEITVQEEAEPVKVMAPTFFVTDIEGNTVKLEDFYGKPIVVNFWASWCGPCKSEMPDFEQAYQTYGEEVHFLMINMTDGMGETVKSAHTFIEKQGYTFPVYYDTSQNAAMTYGVNSIPRTYFIDKEGHAVTYASGMITKELLQTGLDMIYTP